MLATRENINLIRVWLRALRPLRTLPRLRLVRRGFARLLRGNRVSVHDLESIAKIIGEFRRDGHYFRHFETMDKRYDKAWVA